MDGQLKTISYINSPDYYGYSIIGVNVGSGNLAYNNLIYNVPSNYPFGSPVSSHNYNAWFDSTGGGANGAGESSAQIGKGNPFVNLAGHDYRLKVNTDPGTALTAGYATDPLGKKRTTWTRGAYEY